MSCAGLLLRWLCKDLCTAAGMRRDLGHMQCLGTRKAAPLLCADTHSDSAFTCLHLPRSVPPGQHLHGISAARCLHNQCTISRPVPAPAPSCPPHLRRDVLLVALRVVAQALLLDGHLGGGHVQAAPAAVLQPQLQAVHAVAAGSVHCRAAGAGRGWCQCRASD